MTTLLAPAALPPRVAIIAVRLPADGYAVRIARYDQDTLIVGFDPDRLTRSTVELLLTAELGQWTDLDAEATR